MLREVFFLRELQRIAASNNDTEMFRQRSDEEVSFASESQMSNVKAD